MLDPSLAGRRYPPSRSYEVSREKIREFAAAVGDDHPAYTDPAAARKLGHPDVIAPPTFPVVFTWAACAPLLTDPDLAIDMRRLLHGGQRFSYLRPVAAGDRLRTEVSIDSIKTLSGNDVLATRGEVRTESGDDVLTAYSTLIVRR